jgi:hypothetical protein
MRISVRAHEQQWARLAIQVCVISYPGEAALDLFRPRESIRGHDRGIDTIVHDKTPVIAVKTRSCYFCRTIARGWVRVASWNLLQGGCVSWTWEYPPGDNATAALFRTGRGRMFDNWRVVNNVNGVSRDTDDRVKISAQCTRNLTRYIATVSPSIMISCGLKSHAMLTMSTWWTEAYNDGVVISRAVFNVIGLMQIQINYT